jgi:tetratricopeptide (TPR) repeat protein
LSADKRPQLINVPFLAILASLIAAMVLVLAFKAGDIEKALEDERPDALSVAYLKALLQAAPADPAVRFKLVRHYLAVGNWLTAEQVLEAGGDSLMALPQAQWLLLQIHLAQYRATSPEQAQWRSRQKVLADRIAALPETGFTASQLIELADISLQLSLPREAMGFYAKAAAVDTRGGSPLYAAAARSALAANQPSLAGDYYRQALKQADDRKKAVELALAAAGAYEAADQGDRALEVMRMVLQQYQEDRTLLERGVALALARQQAEMADEWNRRLLEQRPDDLPALERQLALALQQGHKEEALACSRRLIQNAPRDPAMLRRHAELAQWNSRYAEALGALQKLATKTRESGVYWHIQELAETSYEIDTELQTLGHLAARPDLNAAQLLKLAERFEYLGYPEKADALLAVPAPDKGLLTARALLRERMGDPEAALEIRRRLAARHDARPVDTLQVARLLWKLGRTAEAYETIRRLPAGYVPADTDTALLMGELAWLQADYPTAAEIYRRLWQDSAGRDFARRRMILAYRQSGRTAEAVAILEARWRRTGDGGDLIAAIAEARRNEMWPELGRLLDQAGRASGRIAAQSRYWLLKGDWHSHRQEHSQAFQAFHRALDLDPRSTAAADGLLWSLINADDREQLDLWLATLTRRGLPFSEARAAALQVLGRYREALAWYRDRIHLHRNDALWLMNLGDLLDQCGRPDAALKVRRQALQVVLAEREREPDDRRTALIAALEGIPAAGRWLAGQPAEFRQAVLLNWWLQLERFDNARMWLLQHHVQRLQLPAWQQLLLAMNAQDRPAVAELLRGGRLNDSGDRMTAYTFLGRDDLALAEIGGADELTTGRLAAAAAAADRVPHFGELACTTLQSDGLAMVEQEVRGWTSHDRHSWGLEAGLSRFEAGDDTVLIAAPGPEFTVNAGWRLRHKGLWEAAAGLRSGDGDAAVPLKLGYRSPAGRRWQYRLNWRQDDAPDAGLLLRMLGTVDGLSAGIDYRIDPRLSTSLRGGLHRYQSLGNGDLADGGSGGWTLTYRLAEGVNSCFLSLGAAWEQNTVARELPADLRPVFTADTTPAVMVPESYREIGLTLHLGRGELRADFPQAASPRWFAELWLGNVEPETGLSLAARTGLGAALFGSDELGLTAEYDNRLDRTAGSEATLQVRLSYRYYFGR